MFLQHEITDFSLGSCEVAPVVERTRIGLSSRNFIFCLYFHCPVLIPLSLNLYFDKVSPQLSFQLSWELCRFTTPPTTNNHRIQPLILEGPGWVIFFCYFVEMSDVDLKYFTSRKIKIEIYWELCVVWEKGINLWYLNANILS